jgi:hypothetical protein
MIEDAQQVADRLEQIAFDGVIDDAERADFQSALDFLRQLEESITDMILLGTSIGKERAVPAGTGNGPTQK